MQALRIVNKALRRVGLSLERASVSGIPADLDENAVQVIHDVLPFTMTSPERLNAALQAGAMSNALPGDVVECGVWRGGSMMAMAMELLRLGSSHRVLHLFDTFEGMPEPGERDVDMMGVHASVRLADEPRETGLIWAKATVQDVQRNLAETGYSHDKISLAVGAVERTIPAQAPEAIAVLRLDTDWYESTAHELQHLVPRVVPGGVLTIDDYGHWKGARRAVDEYLLASGRRLLLNRIDYTGRIAVVP